MDVEGYRLTVTGLDGRRVAVLHADPLPAPEDGADLSAHQHQVRQEMAS